MFSTLFSNIFTTRAIAGLIFWAVGLLILSHLWLWQLDRMAWKEQLIAKLAQEDQQEEHPVIDLDLLKSSTPKDLFLQKFETETAQMPLDVTQFVFVGPRPKDGRPGFHLYAPMPLSESQVTLIAHLGWIAEDDKEQITAALESKSWPERLIGYFVMQDPSPIIQVRNFPDENIWLRASVEDLSDYFGLSPLKEGALDLFNDRTITMPAFFYVEHQFDDRLEPFYYKDITLRNNHAQYARFWLLMCFAWTFIFLMAGIWPVLQESIPFLRKAEDND